MNVAPSAPLAEVTTIAIQVLIHEIGIVNTARFINQFTTGYGDYVQEKEQLFGAMTVDEIIKAIQEHKQAS